MFRKMKLLLVTVVMIFTLLANPVSALAATIQEIYDNPNQIRIALYPYIHNYDYLKKITLKHWQEINPKVKLKFVEWDCYYTPSINNIDIVMYDSFFMSYFIENDLIQPLPATAYENAEDSFDYALEGSKHNGELYGIPTLLCSDFLVYDKNDTEMEQVNNIFQLHKVIGDRKTPGLFPSDRSEGLIVSYPDNYPFYYLDAMVDFAADSHILDTVTSIYDEEDINRREALTLETIMNMVGKEKAMDFYTDSEFPPIHAASRFNEGRGRAFIGYSEDMVLMPDMIDQIAIKTISFSYTEDVQLFFSDVLSINKRVKNEKKIENCLKLMNMIASEEFLRDLLTYNGEPQYMLPARPSLLASLAEEYPMYARLNEILHNDKNAILRAGAGIYDYLATAYTTLASVGFDHRSMAHGTDFQNFDAIAFEASAQ